MANDRDAGEGGQQARRHEAFPPTSNSFSPNPHFSTSSHHPQPLALPQAFIPYAPFLANNAPSGLPHPPAPVSSYSYPPANPSTSSSSSSGYPLGHAPTHSHDHAHSHSVQHNELSPLMTNLYGSAAGLASPTLNAPATNSNFGQGSESAESPGAGGNNANQSKVVQKADRSCKKCRERRVRCDRQYPACARCTKRREQCSYGTGVFIETVEEGSDAAKIAELEQKVATLETQLKNATSKESLKHPPRTASSSPAQKSLNSLARESLAAVVANAVTSGLSIEERNVLDQLIGEQDQTSLYGEPRAGGGGATSRRDVGITCFLLDASTRACCTKLPGLHLLRDRLPYFKANLNALDPPHRLAVVCMCAVGIRVYPNPALFGVKSVTQPDGTPIPHLFRTVGAKRDQVCQNLCQLAIEGCWEMGILRTRSYDNLDALIGFVQYLIHEEGKPEDARFFVRELVGMYLDLRHEELSTGVPTKLNEANTTAVFLADSAVSSTCNKPSFITPIDLQDYFATGGLRVPDLVNMQLGELIDENLGIPLNRPGLVNMLTLLCLYVFSCHRVFCQVANPRRPTGSSILPFLRNLWSVLDQIHQAVQRLQQHLVNLSSAPQGYVDDPQAIDHAILLAVRADNSLVDLIMLIHVHLNSKYSESTFWPEKDGDEELERMRSESTMRVYKCLKLLAFYCQLYLASQDKHNVFHLILRLELLPEWTTMVAARIGSPGGPISEEFEATQEELDWLRCALELACYYSPQASARLAALQSARHTSSTYSAPSPASSAPRPFEQHSQPSRPLNDLRAPSQHMQLQQQYVDTPPTSSSTLYQSHSTSASVAPSPTTSVPFIPPVPHSLPVASPSSFTATPTPTTADVDHVQQNEPVDDPSHVVFGQDFAMHGVVTSMSSTSPTGSAPSDGFADGAGEDVMGGSTDAVKNAFRSLDWVDLSLTPAIGSGSDGSSADGGNGDRYKVRKGRPS